MAALGLSLGLPFRPKPAPAGGGATPYDPNDLTFNPGVRAHFWHINTAAFQNGGVAAGDGDPISRIDSECTAVTTYNHDKGGGSSFVLRSDSAFVDGVYTGYYLTNLPGGNMNVETSGLTIGVQFSDPGTELFMFGGEDFSPKTSGFFLENDGGKKLRLYGDSGSPLSTGVLDLSDGLPHEAFVFVEPGTSPLVANIVFDGEIVATGTVPFSNPNISRDIMYAGIGGCNVSARFFASQSFLDERDNLRNFAIYGPTA